MCPSHPSTWLMYMDCENLPSIQSRGSRGVDSVYTRSVAIEGSLSPCCNRLAKRVPSPFGAYKCLVRLDISRDSGTYMDRSVHGNALGSTREAIQFPHDRP